MNSTKLIGLLGYPLTHSFSSEYFTNKFLKENIQDFLYQNFEINNIHKVSKLVKDNSMLIGLNVTIPYKESVIPYLDQLSEEAKLIGAVNTICIDRSRSRPYLTGHNTDCIGFDKSLDLLKEKPSKGALVLGTGGASKAVNYVLKNRGVRHLNISRIAGDGKLSYSDINNDIIREYPLIINTTPLGMYPKIEEKPAIPYEFIKEDNCLIDLIYNPDQTLFLKIGAKAGAKTLNGLPMLIAQAEASWELWT